MPTSATTSFYLLGVRLVVDVGATDGDAVFDSDAWHLNWDTYYALRSRSVGVQASIIDILKQARKEGRKVVSGIVTVDSRRPAPGQARKQRANLDDLSARAKALVVQIATLLDAGALDEGQVSELTRTYAALQAERDALNDDLDEIDTHLSMGRGLVIEFTVAP